MIPRLFSEIVQGSIQLFLPVHCIQCQTSLYHQALPLCPICRSNLEKVDQKVISKLLNQGNTHQIPLHALFSLWYFDNKGTVQTLHHYLKYANRPGYGINLGLYIGQEIIKTTISAQLPDLILPIPLHQKRYLERGYNQSSMLAKGIGKTLDRPVLENVLSRPYATKTQTGLNKQDRKKNVASAFFAENIQDIQDRHVLLVDDILTTGATLFSAAKTLHVAGVKTISIATLAFTRP